MKTSRDLTLAFIATIVGITVMTTAWITTSSYQLLRLEASIGGSIVIGVLVGMAVIFFVAIVKRAAVS